MKGKYILSVPNFWKNNIQIKIPIYSQNSGLKPKPVYRIGANYAYLLPTTHLPFFSGKKKKFNSVFKKNATWQDRLYVTHWAIPIHCYLNQF